MKESDIEWKKVEKTGEEIQRIYIFPKDGEIEKIDNLDFNIYSEEEKNYKIEYSILKFQKNDKETYYQRVIIYPFYAKSQWCKTEPKPVDIKNLVVSKLKEKYKSIQKRHCENQNKLTWWGEQTDKEPSKIPNYIYHQELDTQVNKDEKLGTLWQDFIVLNDKKYFENETNCKLKNNFDLSIKTFCEKILMATCEYCGITIEQIYKCNLQTKRARGYTMEIDQVNAYGGYSETNTKASCYWCNNAKTDEFSLEEFKCIARGINTAWNERLGKNGKVRFPEEKFYNEKPKCI
jgi:hypothetical protein